jgi:hypothetical protein
MKRIAEKSLVLNFIFTGILTITTASQAMAYEYKDTHAKAALDDGRVSAAWYSGGVLSKYLGNLAPSATTKILQNTETGMPLTQAKIAEVMKSIAKSPTANLTVGEYGGGELTIWLDSDHLRRFQGTGNAGELAKGMRQVAPNIAEAAHELSGTGPVSSNKSYSVSSRQEGIGAFNQSVKVAEGFAPKFEPMTINVGKAGSEGTIKQLQEIMKSGARIQKIAYNSLASRALIPNALKGLGVASAFPAISHLGTAIYHAGKSVVNKMTSENDAVCQAKTHCEEPGLVKKALVSTAPLPETAQKVINAVLAK